MKAATIPPIRDQSEFVRRGLAAITRSEADGDWIPAETVIAKLEAKVAAARERQKNHPCLSGCHTPTSRNLVTFGRCVEILHHAGQG